MRQLLLAAVFCGVSCAAYAHDDNHQSDWIGDHHYVSPAGKGHCCGVGDCGMLDDGAVRPVPGGYQVHGTVRYFYKDAFMGDHERIDEFEPADTVLHSEDAHYWRCRMNSQTARCFFVPPTFSMAD